MNLLRGFGIAMLAAGLALAGLSAVVRADEGKLARNATGTWKSTFETPNGQTIVTTFQLKQDGTKLTGTVTGRRGQKSKIEEGKVKDGEVSFQVTRERQGQKFTIKYHGKQDGDTIKGSMEIDRGEGEPFKRDWEAKREKAGS